MPMGVIEPPFLERYGYTSIQHPDGLYYSPRWPGTDESLMDLEVVGLLGHTSMRRGEYRYILPYPDKAP
jgi:hypothetical protein